MNLFEQLYNASEDALKKMKAPIAERKVKRKFQTGFDNGISDILDNTNEIQKMLEDVENLDITKLVNLSDSVQKLTAVCMNCKCDYAIYSQKLKKGGNIIEIGDLGLYEPRCLNCFVPGGI